MQLMAVGSVTKDCRTRTLLDCPLQGKYIVLFFYPLDFTFVCPTEITAFSDRHGDFEKVNAEVGLYCSAVRCLRHQPAAFHF